MQFEPTAIPDVVLIRPQVFGDDRGFFLESWNERRFTAGGLELRFVQDNHSRSRRGTLRGLHYQVDQPQGKLVRAASGAVFDVAVDLRRSSATFGRWVGASFVGRKSSHAVDSAGLRARLSGSERVGRFHLQVHRVLRVRNASARFGGTIGALDVAWPLPAGAEPLLSAKDRAASAFSDAEYF